MTILASTAAIALLRGKTVYVWPGSGRINLRGSAHRCDDWSEIDALSDSHDLMFEKRGDKGGLFFLKIDYFRDEALPLTSFLPLLSFLAHAYSF